MLATPSDPKCLCVLKPYKCVHFSAVIKPYMYMGTTCFCQFVVQLADAMELMLLSVLGPAVKCQWQLSTAEEAAITSVSVQSPAQ